MKQAFLIKLVTDSTVPIPREVVEAVVDNSTARDAIAEGLWGWFPGPDHVMVDEDMIDVMEFFLTEIEVEP